MAVRALSHSGPLAVVHARHGRLPAGADEAVAEAGDSVLVVGSGAREACEALPAARRMYAETGPGLAPGRLAALLAPALEAVPLIVLPASADGRDLAPRLAAELGRPLLANVTAARLSPDPARPVVRADLARLDDRLLVEVEADAPAVVSLVPGVRGSLHGRHAPGAPVEVALGAEPPERGDPVLAGEVDADVATMDLAEATRVFGGGYGLAAGSDDATATALFGLLGSVAEVLGAALGATRVATDAGWVGHERQVGTTGVAVDPDLYVAFGVSGASQHVGGLGTPRTVVSVNLDPSCPMTAMADLGIVTDARSLVVELAGRLGVAVPEEVLRG